MNTKQKVVSLEQLKTIAANLKKQGKKIVTTNGAFDILHVDHKIVLEESKSLGDVLIVGINSDSSIKQYKSTLRPIMPEAQRAELIAGLACVDYVAIFPEPRPMNFLELVKPNIHTKGGDYQDIEKLYETDTVRKNGGEVVLIQHPILQTTTSIIKSMAEVYWKNFVNSFDNSGEEVEVSESTVIKK